MSARTPGMIPRALRRGASLKSMSVSECRMTPEMYSASVVSEVCQSYKRH